MASTSDALSADSGPGGESFGPGRVGGEKRRFKRGLEDVFQVLKDF